MNNEKTAYHFFRGGLAGYARAKIRMLKEDFCIRMTDAEEIYMLNLSSEAEMDQYGHQLITERL